VCERERERRERGRGEEEEPYAMRRSSTCSPTSKANLMR
jgi:hypothetical protein